MLALVLMALIPIFKLLIIPIFIYGLGQGLTIATLQNRLLGSVGPEQRGTLLGANGVLLRVGQTIAPFFFSLLASGHGHLAPFWAGAGIALATLLLVVWGLGQDDTVTR